MSPVEPLVHLTAGLAGAAGAAAVGAAAVALGYASVNPRSSFFGPVIWKGPSSANAVALSFDDGPHPRFTPKVMVELAKRNAHATFFCVGREVDAYPALAREVLAAGHQLGNHTYSHGLGADLFSERRLTEDLRRCQDSLAKVIGAAPRYYRPAVGVRNPAVHAAARNLGLTVVTWTHAARDGAWPLSNRRARTLGNATRAGDIVTLHDGTIRVPDSRREGTLAHLPALLDLVCGAGFRLVTLDALLAGG